MATNTQVDNVVTLIDASCVNADTGTGTCVSNAVTISKMAGVITTEALTTAAGAAQAITLTNTLIATGDMVFVTVAGGTNTRKHLAIEAVAGSGSATITINNIGAASAVNGTIILNFIVVKQ